MVRLPAPARGRDRRPGEGADAQLDSPRL